MSLKDTAFAAFMVCGLWLNIIQISVATEYAYAYPKFFVKFSHYGVWSIIVLTSSLPLCYISLNLLRRIKSYVKKNKKS